MYVHVQENIWVGLRPGRAPLRLETEEVASVPVVHCYGHGGSGITLAMGCAEDVVANHVVPRLGLSAQGAASQAVTNVSQRVRVEFKPRARL